MQTIKRTFNRKKSLTTNVKRYFHPWSRKDEQGNTQQVWEVGDFVAGRYLMDIKDRYKKDCPIIEVMECNLSTPVTDKEGKEIEIVGEKLQLNGSTSLRNAIHGKEGEERQVQIGECIEVIYKGKEKVKSGEYEGTMTHTFDVNVIEFEESSEEEETF